MSHVRRAALAVLASSIVATAAAVPAVATDGVIEINQARAKAGGVTPTDTPDFPVTIDHGGSYRLTSDLVVATANTDAILVTTTGAEVTIDLNGFSILGPVTCTGVPVTDCSTSGSGRGIYGGDPTGRLRVTNGAIRGMGDVDVWADGEPLSVDSLHVSHSQYGILSTAPFGQVSDTVVERVRHEGISLGGYATVRNCTATMNGGTGISASSGTITGSVANQNGADGIGGSAGTVSGNTANDNAEDGISVGSATLTGNMVSSNGRMGILAVGTATVTGNTVLQNASHGIELNGSSTVLDNTVSLNGGLGLLIPNGGAYGRNLFDGNNGGNANPQISGAATQIGTNVCGTAACP